MLVCHFEMFAVGGRCALFPSTLEVNSYFEEEIASTFREEKSVDTHFSLPMVSVIYFNPKYQFQVILPRAFVELCRFTFRVELQKSEKPFGFSNKSKTYIRNEFLRDWLSL